MGKMLEQPVPAPILKIAKCLEVIRSLRGRRYFLQIRYDSRSYRPDGMFKIVLMEPFFNNFSFFNRDKKDRFALI